jgi:hypothetical protein
MMAGGPIVARLFAHVVFWALLGYGALLGELRLPRIAVLIGVWLAVLFGVPRLVFDPYAMVAAAGVAVLDIVVLLMLFKGDIRLT